MSAYESFEHELNSIIACNQSDGELIKWAKKELEKLQATCEKD